MRPCRPRSVTTRHLSSVVRLGTLALLGSSLTLGCAADTTVGTAPVDPAHTYYQLVLNARGITMALTPPYDTLQLRTVALSEAGDTIQDTSSTTYINRSQDPNLLVSPTGLLTAVGPDAYVQVVASRTIGRVTHTDTAWVNINDINDPSSVPVFSRLAFQFCPDTAPRVPVVLGIENSQYYMDSPCLGAAGNHIPGTMQVTALDVHGDSIPNVILRVPNNEYEGPNNRDDVVEQWGVYNFLANGGTPQLSGVDQPGVYKFVFQATIYGTSRTDTVLYSVGWPERNVVAIDPYTPAGRLTPLPLFGPVIDTVAVGAVVAWDNTLRAPVDITFDNPAAIQSVDSAAFREDLPNPYGGIGSAGGSYVIPQEGGGNIPAFLVDTVQVGGVVGDQNHPPTYDRLVHARQFPVAGTYHYHSTLFGTSGVITVLPGYQGLHHFFN